MPARRQLLAVAAIGTLLLAGCGDDTGTDTTTAAPATTAVASATTAATAPTPAAPTTAAPTAAPSTSVTAPPTTVAGTVIEITYRGGKVDGGGRRPVTKGQPLTLRVTSDIADEAHVHGYDKTITIPANGTGEVTFVANVSGVFEVELHKKGLKIVDLEVK